MRMQVTQDSAAGIVLWGSTELYLPSRFTVLFDEPGRDATVEVVVEVVDGQPRCQRITCTARESGFVSSETLKGLPVTHYLRLAASAAAMRAEPAPGGGIVLEPVGTDDGEVVREGLRRVGRKRQLITPAFLEQVSDVYRDNIRGAPTQAVAEHFHTSRQNAGKWIKRARELGVLEEEVR